jgi:hypothetical protein
MKGLLGFGFGTAMLTSVIQLENSFTKTFGGVVVSLLVVWLTLKFILPRWCPWVLGAVRR